MSWCARQSSDLAFKNARVYRYGSDYLWRRVGTLCLVIMMIWLSAPGLAAAASMVPDNSAPTLIPALGRDGTVMDRPVSLLPDINQVLMTTGNHSTIDHAPVAGIGTWSRILKRTAIWKLSLGTTLVLGLLYLAYRGGSKVARKALLWCDARAMGVRHIVNVDAVDYNDLMNPAAVRGRGWSPELMGLLLGAPDYAIIDPTNRAEPLVFISRKRVERLEMTRAFRNDAGMRKRQAAASDLRISKWISLQEDGGVFLGAVREGV